MRLRIWVSGLRVSNSAQKNAGASPRKRRHLFSDCLQAAPPCLSPSIRQMQDVVRRVPPRRLESVWSMHEGGHTGSPLLSTFSKQRTEKKSQNLKTAYGITEWRCGSGHELVRRRLHSVVRIFPS